MYDENSFLPETSISVMQDEVENFFVKVALTSKIELIVNKISWCFIILLVSLFCKGEEGKMFNILMMIYWKVHDDGEVMENFFAHFRKSLRELFVNFGIAAAYSNLIYYSTSLSRKWLMEASNLLYAGQSSVYRRKEENNCTSFCLYSAVVANGHDHAVDDGSPRGPGLKEVFLTMRFVFDGTDTFERSTFAVSIVLYLNEFGKRNLLKHILMFRVYLFRRIS